MAEKINDFKNILSKGRELIEKYYNSDERVRTVSVRLLEHHTDFCEMIADWMKEKASGNNDAAKKLFDEMRIKMGAIEPEIQLYFDHNMCFSELARAQNLTAKNTEFSTY